MGGIWGGGGGNGGGIEGGGGLVGVWGGGVMGGMGEEIGGGGSKYGGEVQRRGVHADYCWLFCGGM